MLIFGNMCLPCVRERTENPAIAAELSLQPWRRFGLDGVIMFSDILTPLPAMGIEYNIRPGKGPVIDKPIRTKQDLSKLVPLNSVDSQIPYIKPLLQVCFCLLLNGICLLSPLPRHCREKLPTRVRSLGSSEPPGPWLHTA
jgi:hypothetical protein